ncbi:MAG: hypothetical protein EOM69_09805 [Clostridia bacterium]|nr:hypothetical protein [Clostridia bacterium]
MGGVIFKFCESVYSISVCPSTVLIRFISASTHKNSTNTKISALTGARCRAEKAISPPPQIRKSGTAKHSVPPSPCTTRLTTVNTSPRMPPNTESSASTPSAISTMPTTLRSISDSGE